MVCVSASAQKPIRIYSTYAESRAASQLQQWLEKGGCRTTFGGRNTGHTIYVGLTPEMKAKYRPQIDSLRDDGYFIVGNGRDVVLYGKGEKGTIYAVYAFLEKLGYRMYTPDAVVVPDLSNNFQFSTFNFQLVENPAFEYREVAYYYPNQSQLYADWHHVHTQADRERMFGMYVHTFGKQLPPALYFDEHPEWYSLNNGRRSRDGQLCLSNPAVLKELCKRLADTMSRRPEARIWSVSPNDNYNACECADCRRLDSLYGGQSGTLLWFVNQVARRFRYKTISTLAYQYTRKAPTSDIKLDENVLVMLCPIESGRQAPIPQTDPAFRKDMEDWSRLCSGNTLLSQPQAAASSPNLGEQQNSEALLINSSPKLGEVDARRADGGVCNPSGIYLWDYVVQFRNFWDPFPNLHVLQPNLQFFKENGASMMFEQATGAQNVTSWMDIRCYMISKLLWNPYCNIDSIMDDFYQGYYGEAGRYVKEIIDTMTAALIRSGQALNIYGYPVDAVEGYLSEDLMLKYYDWMGNARDAAKGDSAVLERLRFFQLALDFAWLELQHGEPDKDAMLGAIDSLEARLQHFRVPQMMEMGCSPAEYASNMRSWAEKAYNEHLAPGKPVTLRRPATAPYNTAGLADGEVGIMDYRHRWLGFWGDTLDAVIDLGEPQPITYIGIDFYFYPLSWIFLPQWVQFALSDDGERWEWRPKDVIENPEVLATPDIYTYASETACTIGGEPNKYRYVRVVAVPLPEIPSWHRASGQKPWIFTDEIIIK
ncbi:MAG: DUF4838 domain-containing protein [Bacteroidales bacterium]|nr:DUF4838 domain-containing protein [Bacteroidales bacterium]